jgi:hypothetical protein
VQSGRILGGVRTPSTAADGLVNKTAKGKSSSNKYPEPDDFYLPISSRHILFWENSNHVQSVIASRKRVTKMQEIPRQIGPFCRARERLYSTVSTEPTPFGKSQPWRTKRAVSAIHRTRADEKQRHGAGGVCLKGPKNGYVQHFFPLIAPSGRLQARPRLYRRGRSNMVVQMGKKRRQLLLEEEEI